MSEGDLRKAITFLQSATRLTGGKEVTGKVITDIAGVRALDILKFLVGSFVASRKFLIQIYIWNAYYVLSPIQAAVNKCHRLRDL